MKKFFKKYKIIVKYHLILSHYDKFQYIVNYGYANKLLNDKEEL